MWKKVENSRDLIVMNPFFFSGSSVVKLDDKNRFVLPSSMRLGLVENGKQEFSIGLGLGGCLVIYRSSDMEKIVEKFREKQHQAKYQKFFTLFFSTLYHTSPDKIGRTHLPKLLQEAVGIETEIVVAGVLDRIELWPKKVYEQNLRFVLDEDKRESDLAKMAEEAFALLEEKREEKKEGSSLYEKVGKVLTPSGTVH